MAENRTARPVSGEIMTGPATNAALERAMSNAPDIVDADYVVLPRFAAHPELSPRQTQIPPTPAIKGMGILRKPDASLPRPSRGGPMFWIAGVGDCAGLLLGVGRPRAGPAEHLLGERRAGERAHHFRRDVAYR
ncbi:hypothetical protein ACVOMV_02895 [Mesorhizobium atlanticum]